ncbi:MAG: cyclophilin-like fold protein [Candidatus Thorarchaeota archaeon]
MSDTDLVIAFEFEGGLILESRLNRVNGPLIVEDIKSMLPFQGRTALLRGEMKITMGINRGNLKATKDVQRGDIAYMPLGDSLCIYLKDMKTFSPVNVLGSISTEDSILDQLESVRRGSNVTIRSAD